MATIWNGWYWHLGLASFVAMSGAIASGNCVLAQVTPDGTLPNNSIVTPQDNTSIIDGGTQAGSNLFHSFEQFSVPTGGAAFFNNALDIQNIISRVTGGNISNIDGLLRANDTANLFLINPNGIIFGPNASLDIGGSFVGSTASSLNFADGTQFSATAPQTTPLLTVSVPLGLQFGPQAGEIRMQGPGAVREPDYGLLLNREAGLSVQPSETLTLVGSGVALSGGILTTEGGRIELGSVAGPGLMNLTPIDSGWALGYEGVLTFGDIQLSGAAAVDASGAGGGDIQVQGRRVTLTNGSQIEASTLGAEPGGTLSVTASDVVELIGTAADGQLPSGLFASTFGDGNAGNLTIATGRLNVRDGALVSASTFGTGAGGTLSVTASDVVEVIGVTADGQFPSALFTFTSAESNGNAGDLTIATGRLTVRDGAQVSAGTFGTRAGGTLSVTASDVVELIGRSADGRIGSGLFASAESNGNAGDLTIATGRLTVRDGAQVAVRSRGSGNAGSLRVAASSVLLENKGNLLASTASGEGGNIDLQIQDLILMRANSLISAEAEGTGNGGNITINTPFIVAVPSEDSDIFANAILGRGGNIFITTQGIYGLEYRSSRTLESDINASSEFGVEGTVEINNPDVDPTQGLVELPAELVDASNQIATGCAAGEENEFIITGRGGLPPNPRQVLSSNAVQVDWVELSTSTENRSSTKPATNSTIESAPTTIVEANGWVKSDNGEVTLVATAPTANIDIPWLPNSDCHASEPES